jgi:Tfp pilus assembly pilus retraction ATPase PilT
MQLVVVERADAIHIHDLETPVLETHQQLDRVEGPCLKLGDTQTLLRSIASAEQFHQVARTGLAMFTHKHGDAASFRVMIFKEDDRLRLEARRVFDCDHDA